MQSVDDSKKFEKIYHICFSFARQISTHELLYHGGAIIDFSLLIRVHNSIFLLKATSVVSINHVGIALKELLQQGLVDM